ncbi:glycosyl hydrolase family 47-domain-containing protein [Protomyces lactucae-debilis]|uniref:alpha-1,2-Mannosidase n=1 Tax=Protomyces lactucae-debilis TaxID=2754530 RepID=A0A1Y2FP41_PROLT|nr:glycosyl hydrolase family 47-domain-containing protein [Protomyces lactucae-debilis]ORY85751.1 glycosyl hydrolase family 47-domain-containing protein [Protomyces lactucae-debilis]
MAHRVGRRLRVAVVLVVAFIFLYKVFLPDLALDELVSGYDADGSYIDPFKKSARPEADRMHPKIKQHLDTPEVDTGSGTGTTSKTQEVEIPAPSKQTSPSPVVRPAFNDGRPEDVTPSAAPSSAVYFDLKRKERFPVELDRRIPLPVGSPGKLPQIQAKVPAESVVQTKERHRRRDAVRDAFKRDWDAYRKYAWMHDEIKPVTQGSHDPFGGWGATLVDALDTLLLMGLTSEFKEAEDAVAKIDFTRKTAGPIPVFETTIRYLGGLLSAHDLAVHQGMKAPVMLKQAKLLGKVLYGAFDTPNRMPVLLYNFEGQDTAALKAPVNGVTSELGSLLVEFTRLAQLSTGEERNQFYDAVARITNELEESQDDMDLPGLWPKVLDMSGCEPEKYFLDSHAEEEATATSAASSGGIMDKRQDSRFNSGQNSSPEDFAVDAKGMPISSSSRKPIKNECVKQGLKPSRGQQAYTLGAMVDSLYEYFTKEYLLLGGVKEVEQYKRLYERSIEAAKKHLLFKPLVPGDLGKDKILFSGYFTSGGINKDEGRFDANMEHLTCFVGGMFGLGAKVFHRPQDMEIAIKLTEGCVWAYSATASGIMPETFRTEICTESRCSWDKHVAGLKKSFEQQEEENSPDWAVDMDRTPSKPMAAELIRVKRQESTRQKGTEPDAPNEAARLSQQALEVAERTKTQKSYGKPEWEDPPAMTVYSSAYVLRPEAIESVWYMWRLTGDRIWQEKGWKMWQAVEQHTRSEGGHSAIHDVNSVPTDRTDHCESFWFAETLKYFYLLFADFDVVSLDEWVLNTEAHPFKLQ